MRTWLTASALAVLTAAAIVPAHAAGEPLRVCLDENLPPLSAHRKGAPDSGFDVALAEAVAAKLGRPLQIQWFGSKLDEDSSPALEANALLSDGRCALVGSYALTQDSLVAPGVKTAKPPDYEGRSSADRGAASHWACWRRASLTSMRRSRSSSDRRRATAALTASPISPGCASRSRAERWATPS